MLASPATAVVQSKLHWSNLRYLPVFRAHISGVKKFLTVSQLVVFDSVINFVTPEIWILFLAEDALSKQ